MLWMIQSARRDRRDYLEFMIHSSELMPGGSPYFPDGRSVERLYEDLEAVFSAAAGDFECLTLAEYADRFAGARLQSASQ
jgi:hypothetical protein